MRFLKKASIDDVLGKNRESVTVNYKEIELFTTEKDIERLDDKFIKDIVSKLHENNAIISAIHCPESRFKTSNDYKSNISTNYLSVCESIMDEDSKKLLFKMIEFSNKIYEKQWSRKNNNIEDIDYSEINNSKATHEEIRLIIHSGCIIGCEREINESKIKCIIPNGARKEKFKEELKEVLKDKKVQIVVENITPYIDDINKIKKGQNCGWSYKHEDWNAFKIAKELELKVCIDFCHIFATHHILTGDSNYEEALKDYFEYIKDNNYKSLISMFHLSNYSTDGSHGIQFDNETDKKLLGEIKKYCFETVQTALITLEVADGDDYERACKNFNQLMLRWSELHTSGLFGKLLEDKVNEDLKSYFDNLYFIYTSNINDIFNIRDKANRIKKFILKNTFAIKEKTNIFIPFNFSMDSDEFDTALFKIQAYIYYTRFCNLAIFLSNFYGESSIIEETFKAEDFALALKYFMFNDDVQQIEYTGLAYKFNVDWLPKRDTLFRFNDSIKENKFRDKVNALKKDNEKLHHPMSYIIETIRSHVQGDCCLFSCGRDFGNCLFKYCQPLTNNPKDWTVRVYSDILINFIKYEGRIYSIQAFIQIAKDDYDVWGKIENFSFDVSRFSEGRGDADKQEKKASTLYSLFRYYVGEISSVEKTASIADGEVVFIDLPEQCEEYKLNNYEIIITMKAYLKTHTSISKKDNKNIELENIISDIKMELERLQNDITYDNDLNGLIKIIKETKVETNKIKALLKQINKDEKHAEKYILELKFYNEKSNIFKIWLEELKNVGR